MGNVLFFPEKGKPLQVERFDDCFSLERTSDRGRERGARLFSDLEPDVAPNVFQQEDGAMREGTA